MVSFTNYFVVLQGSEWCQKAQFSEMMYYDTLLWGSYACVLISMRTVFPSEIHTTLLLET